MPLQNVRYQVGEGIATITMNRPEQLNALNFRLKDDEIRGLDAFLLSQRTQVPLDSTGFTAGDCCSQAFESTVHVQVSPT